jgi:hypothetical protein
MHTPATEPIAIPAFPPTERPMSVLAAVAAAEAEEEIAADGDVDGKFPNIAGSFPLLWSKHTKHASVMVMWA